MFVLGVLDMVNLLMFASLNGFLTMIGAVYCSSPGFLYLKGSLSAGANAFLDFNDNLWQVFVSIIYVGGILEHS